MPGNLFFKGKIAYGIESNRTEPSRAEQSRLQLTIPKTNPPEERRGEESSHVHTIYLYVTYMYMVHGTWYMVHYPAEVPPTNTVPNVIYIYTT